MTPPLGHPQDRLNTINGNVCFTEKGRPLDPGCYMTVFDEDIDARRQERTA